ncbi:MAG: flagellar hook-associated protein FlgL [Firmicutes bacterium]|nr:flagellar hook-associated protein FlgL [Bacillota bacterium]
MRITNNMLVRNTMIHMNNNLRRLEKEQYKHASTKNIRVPSDDPIVASRALRFRTDLWEVEQFQKNADDGLSWLDMTEQGLTNLGDVIDRARDLTIQAGGVLSIADKQAIKDEIGQMKNTIVAIGNMSYAGRYIYAGYTTDEPPFKIENYTVDGQQLERLTYKGKILNLGGPFSDTIDDVVYEADFHLPNEGNAFYSELMMFKYDPAYMIDSAAVPPENQFDLALDGIKKTIVLPDGPIDIADIQAQVNLAFQGTAAPPVPRIVVSDEGGRIKFTVRKGEYLRISETDGNGLDLAKLGFEDGADSKQNIEYEIGVGNRVDVNVEGDEVFGRDVAGLFDTFVKFEMALDEKTQYKTAYKNELTGDIVVVTHDLATGDLLADWDVALDRVLKVQANVGARVNYLEMTKARLEDTHLNFYSLKSKNEDADMAEVIINLKMAENVYRSSLAAGARVIQPTLLDFLR